MSIVHSLAEAILQIAPVKVKSVAFKKGEKGMKRRLRCLVGLILVFLCTAVTVGNRPLHGQAVVATVPVGSQPFGVDVNPNTNRVYVSNHESNTVSVIDGAATNPVSKRRDEFIKKNGVEEWPDISELSANPFVYEGQTIAIRACFVTMQTATQGIFVVGDRAFFVVSDIPKGMFKEALSIVVLAGMVLGKTELQLPLLGLMQVPHLKFVGVHFCQDNNCDDIIPEEASLEKATHDSEDRKTQSKNPTKN